jgi:hypothetical protein
MHRFSRADADQDPQDFGMSRSECQRRVEAVAALFNRWKVESRSICDRL